MAARTAFDPARHGFLFANAFKNHIVGNVTTSGRCGGMVYAALDYFCSGVPIPPVTTLPPDGTMLADYLMKRLRDSLIVEGGGFARLLADPNSDGGFQSCSHTGSEWRRLKRFLDRGRSVPLGLIHADHRVGYHHQVLAIGYEIQQARGLSLPEAIFIYIYDPNFPKTVCTLTESGGVFGEWAPWGSDPPKHDWRAYFVDPLYVSRHPSKTAWRRVALRTIKGYYLKAEGGGGGGVSADSYNRGEWETFDLAELSNHQYALKSHGGYYVRIEGDGVVADRRQIGEWESFRLYEAGRVALKAYTGRFLSALHGGGGQLRANGPAPGPYESFDLVPA
jgi:hypothetical protein